MSVGHSVYYIVVVGLMGVLPIVSVLIQHGLAPTGLDWLHLIGRWFVFWGVGARLGLAGVKQLMTPEFTAKSIFEIEDPAAVKIVQELGFYNIALGLAALASIIRPDWVLPCALIGGLFYLMAGIQHLRNGERSLPENTAMISDLVIGIVLLAYAGLALAHPA
jgi:uncharacterized protein DUF6790